MSGGNATGAPKPRRRLDLAGIRWLRFDVEIAFSDLIALNDDQIAAALTDGLLVLDSLGLLFPGIDWPEYGERLTESSVGISEVGRVLHDTTLVSVRKHRAQQLLEQQRQAAAPPPADGPDPADRQAREQLIDQLGDADEELEALSRQVRAALSGVWQARQRLEDHSAAAETFPGVIEDGRAALGRAMSVLSSRPIQQQ